MRSCSCLWYTQAVDPVDDAALVRPLALLHCQRVKLDTPCSRLQPVAAGTGARSSAWAYPCLLVATCGKVLCGHVYHADTRLVLFSVQAVQAADASEAPGGYIQVAGEDAPMVF